MSERSQEEIETHIKQVIEEYISPVVASHGGAVNFHSYENGNVMLEMSGACSGCAGSTMTLKYGAEQILKDMVPEVNVVDGFDDPFSNIDPFYTDPFMDAGWDTIDLQDTTNDTDNK
jgi:Fe-S cluster biogenesis protein NfuA